MSIKELNTASLTQDELVRLVRLLVDSDAEKFAINDPIVKKYLETLEKDATDLEQTNVTLKTDEKKNQLQELDKQRDKYLSVFRRLMQVYELSDDNSPEANAYEQLNDLWLKKYDSLAYLNLVVETQGIDDLIFDLSTNKYSGHVETLNLTEAVDKIKIANDKFKIIYSEMDDDATIKPNFDARSLRIELIETLALFANYVNVLAESSDNKEMQLLHQNIHQIFRDYRKEVAHRHSGNLLED